MASKSIFKLIIDSTKTTSKTSAVQLIKGSPSLFHTSPEDLSSQEISQVIYSLAYLQFQDEKYWRTLENYYFAKREEMNTHDFVASIWGFCRVPKLLHKSTLKSLENATNAYLMEFSPKEISSICHSFTVGGYSSPKLWENLKNAAMRQLYYMPPVSLTPLIWAFSKNNIQDEKVWSMFEKKALLERKNISLSHTCVLMYSFSKLEKGSESFWNEMEAIVEFSLDNLTDSDFRNVTWALRRMKRIENNKLWSKMTESLKKNLESYTTRTVINFLNSNKKESLKEGDMLEIGTKLNQQKIVKMSYEEIIGLARYLYMNQIQNNYLWEKLALRMRQVTPNVIQSSDISMFVFFVSRDKSYWEFVCEQKAIFYFEKISRMDESTRNKFIVDQSLNDFLRLTTFCANLKLGTRQFWNEFSKFLQYKKFDFSELQPNTIADFMYIVSIKYFDVEVLRASWFEYEERICSDLDVLKKFLKGEKLFKVLASAFRRADRFGNLVKQLEKCYKTIDWPHEDINDFILKLMKRENEPNREAWQNKIKTILSGFDHQDLRIIFIGIIEDWINTYCETQLPKSPIYKDFLTKVYGSESSPAEKSISLKNDVLKNVDDKEIIDVDEIIETKQEFKEKEDNENENENEIEVIEEKIAFQIGPQEEPENSANLSF